MKKIITIGREYGAGGRSVGSKVAEKMGLAYYDRDLIMKTAEELSYLTADDVMKWDERLPVNAGFMQSLFDPKSKSMAEQLWKAQVDAIRKIAEKEGCVIVGRNAGYILKEFDHVLNVFIYADKEWRIRHMMKLKNESDRNVIVNEMNSIDKWRHSYVKENTGLDSSNLANYDLTINTGKVGFDKAVELIVSAADVV